MKRFCPGGLDMPVVFEGVFGVYDHPSTGMPGGEDTEKQQRLQGVYVAPGAGKAFSKLSIWHCAGEEACPGEEIERDGESGPESRKDLRWPAPSLEKSGEGCEAGSRREGIACARCEEGFFGDDGGCDECSGATGPNALFIILCPIILHLVWRERSEAASFVAS